MKTYNATYKALAELLRKTDVFTMTYFKIAFYGDFDNNEYGLIKENKIYYFFSKVGTDHILRIAKKSFKTKVFTPNYAYDTANANIIEKSGIL